MSLIRPIFIILFSILLFSACARKDKNLIDRKTQIIAINGHGLDIDFVKDRYLRTRDYANSQEIKSEQIKVFLEKFYMRDLYYLAEAYDQEIDQDTTIKRELRRKKIEVLTGTGGLLYNAIMPDSVNVTEPELRDLYSRMKVRLRIAHIVVGSRELADSLYSLLKQGAAFPELARQYSIDLTTRERGGYIPEFLIPGMNARAIENAAYSMKVNDFSAPIKTVQGYHIVKLIEKQDEKLKTFAEEKDRLTKIMETAKFNQITQHYIDSLFIRFNFKLDGKLADAVLKTYKINAEGTGILDLSKINGADQNLALIQFDGGSMSVAEAVQRYNEQDALLHVTLSHVEDLEHVVKRFVVPELMYQDALRLKLDQTDEFRSSYKLITDNQLLNTLRVRMIEHKIEPTDVEVEKYFNEHRDNWKNQTFEKVKPFVKNRLREDKREILEKSYLNELYNKHDVVYNDSLLAVLAADLTRLKSK